MKFVNFASKFCELLISLDEKNLRNKKLRLFFLKKISVMEKVIKKAVCLF